LPDSSALSQLKAIGLTVEPVRQTPTRTGGTATRTATGLRITVDTVLLRQTLNSVPMLNQTLASVYSKVPAVPQAPVNPQSLLFYTLAASPKITFILAAGVTSAAASVPIVFSYPALPGIPPLTAPVGSGSGAPGALALTPAATGLGPVTPGTPSALGTDPAPQVAAGLVPLAATSAAHGFGGLSPGLVLLALACAALAGRGLLVLRTAALGGPLGTGCSLGMPRDLPNLRGA
jgi:hypothetical protein